MLCTNSPHGVIADKKNNLIFSGSIQQQEAVEFRTQVGWCLDVLEVGGFNAFFDLLGKVG